MPDGLDSALGELSFLPMESNTLKCLAHLDSTVDALATASEMIQIETATSLVKDSLTLMTQLLGAVKVSINDMKRAFSAERTSQSTARRSCRLKKPKSVVASQASSCQAPSRST